MSLFFQLELRPEFELPFEPNSHLLVFQCPVHEDIPTLWYEEDLPPEYWLENNGHYALILNRPGQVESLEATDPAVEFAPMEFELHKAVTRLAGMITEQFPVGKPGFKVGGVPSWAQNPESHRCCCGAEMAFICQIPQEPDPFSSSECSLFLGNAIYIFACAAQCHPMAVWAVVQN